MLKVVSSSPKSVFYHPSTFDNDKKVTFSDATIENKCPGTVTTSPLYPLNISPLVPPTSPVLPTTTRKTNKRQRRRNSFLSNFSRTKNTTTTNDDNSNHRSSSTSMTTLSESYSTTKQNTTQDNNNHHLLQESTASMITDTTTANNRIVATTEKRPPNKNDDDADGFQNNAKRQKRHRRTSTSLFFGDVTCKEETRMLNDLRRDALLLGESSSSRCFNAPGILKQIFSEDSVVHYSPIVGKLDETCDTRHVNSSMDDNLRLPGGNDILSAHSNTRRNLVRASSMPTKYASRPAASLHFSINFRDDYFDGHATGENQPSGISFCQLNAISSVLDDDNDDSHDRGESKDDQQPHDDGHQATTTVVPNDCRELLSTLTLDERRGSGSSLLRQIFPENNIKIVDEFSF